MKTFEALYVAFGYEYLIMSAHSAATAKDHNPYLRCKVITNINIDNINNSNISSFDEIVFIDKESDQNRLIKTKVIDYTNASYCVYLDCDTEIHGSFWPIFSCLDKFDAALKLNPRTGKKYYNISNEIPGYLFPEWNGGVIFFRNNHASKKLFYKLNYLFIKEGKKSDQPTLARAVFETADLRILTLNCIWNTFPEDVSLLASGISESRVLHYRYPHEWPKVIPNLYKLHTEICKSIKSGKIDNDVSLFDTRYKILMSSLYRLSLKHRYLRLIFQKILNLLYKLGLINQRVNFQRKKFSKGEKYNLR